ncbi:hypothetical protein PAPYR_11264 [Paratrimastix pyriformis]|uniref:Uncharacterized protein n=1 Tax=Paratrimastix pyriformis TaxID=342808 RepID=A0ABQ8U458_9EUKA|nr:hypothetical protein PAPYR_11264 [Paratrimastix pyriformis]
MRCDLLIAQKDKSTAGTDMTCQILFDQFLDVSAVLRACCASVHSFLVWTCTRGGRDPLEEMFGVRMVDHESLFFIFIETREL